jgi:hypothetical protein
MGTIYSTSVYCAMAADKTRRDTTNVHIAGVVGHLEDEIYEVVIQIK